MTRTLSLVLAVLLGLCSSVAVAQRADRPRADGPSSRADLKKKLVRLFDRDRDGRLDPREWKQARNILRELRPERRRGGERARTGTGQPRTGEDRADPRARRTGRGGERPRTGPSGERLRRTNPRQRPVDVKTSVS